MKTIPLYNWHTSHQANMSPFGHYEMPLWYEAGMKNEHLAVIKAAGLFDTSHMVGITIAGDVARTTIQRCFSKDFFRTSAGGMQMVAPLQGMALPGIC